MLEVKNLNIEFHDESVLEPLVCDFNLKMEAGEIIGLVGESGSGKTITALSIAGLLRRHDMKKSGEILFQGTELLTCKRAQLRRYQGKEISMIFQEPMTSLNPVKKIGWQVEESLRIHTNMSKEEMHQKAIECLGDVELDNPEMVYNQYPHELSGGMRQRVMIASATICNPKILIADEPTTALDVTIQAQIVKLLRKLNQEKNTGILFISHDLSLVRQLCKRVIVMQGGMVVEEGNTDKIFNHPSMQYTKDLIAAIPDCKKLREV